MGAGASVSDEETVRVTKLIAVISGEKNDERFPALQELSEIWSQDDYKMPLIERGNVLPVLVKILSESEDISDDQLGVLDCLMNLSVKTEAKVHIASEKGMVAALVNIIQRNQGDVRSGSLNCFLNLAISPDAANYLLEPSCGLLNVIAMVLNTDTNEESVKESFWMLANMTTTCWIPDRIDELLRLDLHVLALNVLKPLEPTADTFEDRLGTPVICLQFLMCISAYPEAAILLKSAGALNVLTPLLALTNCDEAIKAALTMAFLAGKDESSAQNAALLQAHPHLTDILVDLFEAQLSGGNGAAYDRMKQLGYNFGWYQINLVVRGVLALSISDANKGALVATKILSPLVQLLQRFHDNAPPVGWEYEVGSSTVTSFAGGGGDDIAAATAAIETIVQLTFFFDSDTELAQQFITPQSGVEKLFGDLLELSADRQFDREAKGQVGDNTYFNIRHYLRMFLETQYP